MLQLLKNDGYCYNPTGYFVVNGGPIENGLLARNNDFESGSHSRCSVYTANIMPTSDQPPERNFTNKTIPRSYFWDCYLIFGTFIIGMRAMEEAPNRSEKLFAY